ncbi:hypothetical protein QA601_05665 [Chitinispirillales bacterium ANBcel5]|uniref:hypothetical protein n=1 Tax=Cellulosispirillum alkaliphilum TaxID=3039283 RepID=UPI002A56915E|nr:hypothetical protein [Chitinispirillales bacterium ANBcel5]
MSTEQLITPKKVFHHYDRSFFFELFFFLFFIPVLTVYWFTSFYTFYLSGVVLTQAFRSAVFLSIVFFALFFFYRQISRDYSSRFILIEDNWLSIKSSKAVQTININNVIAINHYHLPFIKGFIVFKTKDNNSLSVPLYLENSGLMIEELQDLVINSTSPVDFDPQLWSHLKTDTTRYENTRSRHFRTLRPLLGIILSTVFGGHIVATQYWGLPPFFALIFAITGMIFPVGAYFFSDYRLAKPSKNRDENQEFLFSIFMMLMIYMVSGFFLRHLIFHILDSILLRQLS